MNTIITQLDKYIDKISKFNEEEIQYKDLKLFPNATPVNINAVKDFNLTIMEIFSLIESNDFLNKEFNRKAQFNENFERFNQYYKSVSEYFNDLANNHYLLGYEIWQGFAPAWEIPCFDKIGDTRTVLFDLKHCCINMPQKFEKFEKETSSINCTENINQELTENSSKDTGIIEVGDIKIDQNIGKVYRRKHSKYVAVKMRKSSNQYRLILELVKEADKLIPIESIYIKIYDYDPSKDNQNDYEMYFGRLNESTRKVRIKLEMEEGKVPFICLSGADQTIILATKIQSLPQSLL